MCPPGFEGVLKLLGFNVAPLAGQGHASATRLSRVEALPN